MFFSTEFAVADGGDYNYFNGCHNNYIKMCSLQIGPFCFFQQHHFPNEKDIIRYITLSNPMLTEPLVSLIYRQPVPIEKF